MNVVTTPMSDPHWGAFSASHPEATPFHLPEWASVIAECYGFEAFALTVRDSDGEVLAGAPVIAVRSPLGGVRWISLPYSDTCKMLIRDDADVSSVIEVLGHHVASADVRSLEVRMLLPEASGVHIQDVGYIHTLELPDDASKLRPNKGHRYSRNRAMREGVRVVLGTAKDDIDTFYRLHTLTRRRHGVPVQPRRFFDLVWSRLIAPGHGFVTTASYEGEVLAAGVYLGHNGTLVAKYHASDPSQPDRRAGYLIDWETMVAGCDRGYHTLDLGRSDPGADGLRLYKSSWGSAESPLAYTHFSPQAPSSGGLSKAGELSRGIIRRSPLWVCRALGEAMYRWSA